MGGFAIVDICGNLWNCYRMLTARMIVKKTTLLRWIDIISSGQIEYIPRNERKSEEKEFLTV